ncbi:hypothetical protein [Krasilnikovia sp. M28-CT-15]|uniref:hypothetical protein n=1 Tax=Krasilnikovia sp. M28-CT-15 TaxID=3373540 RepID=UPI003875C40C
MTPAGSSALQVALAVAFVIFSAYAAGRVHQWYRQGFERETAYREGYDQASHTLFHLATRALPTAPAEPSTVEPDGGAVAGYGWARAS